jgi:hypothetical protein
MPLMTGDEQCSNGITYCSFTLKWIPVTDGYENLQLWSVHVYALYICVLSSNDGVWSM